MLRTQLIHPQILGALAEAGHGSQVLISDGNFPHVTATPPGARRVYLNLSPGPGGDGGDGAAGGRGGHAARRRGRAGRAR
jgi:L-fucose mutarotase